MITRSGVDSFYPTCRFPPVKPVWKGCGIPGGLGPQGILKEYLLEAFALHFSTRYVVIFTAPTKSLRPSIKIMRFRTIASSHCGDCIIIVVLDTHLAYCFTVLNT